jgi:glucose/arabinose dehydrogenase
VWLAGGQLFLSVGDGGGGGDPERNGQRMDRLMGKLLRITPAARGGYTIPRDNPYVGRSGARGEIWALGLRNPWRFSIDSPTGDIWIGDVGQGQREEINRVRAGRPAGLNFGWPRLEGTTVHDAGVTLAPRTPLAGPFHQYSHDSGGCSVTGGYVHRGTVLPTLRGWYLFADWCQDELQLMNPATKRVVSRQGVGGIVHFGAGPGGVPYAASQQSGRIYRVVAA